MAVVVGACGFSMPASVGSGSDAATDGSPVPIDVALACPANYKPLPGAPSMYRVVGGTMAVPTAGRTTWIGAELDCRDDGTGTHLAIPETQAENQAFVDVLSGASRWLGVTDRKTEGTWVPIIATTGWFARWAGGVPGADDCLLLSRTSFHEAMPCQSGDPQWNKGFICECDGALVDATSF